MNRCSKAIIYTENLKNNIVEIKKCLSPQTKLCIAVKADSYGHNAILTSKLAEEVGVEFLAVATVDVCLAELQLSDIELRNAGIKCNILLLSICIPEEYESLFKYEITPLIFDLENIKKLSDAADKYFTNNAKFKVQLAVDTGMGRIGCYPDEAGEQAQVINNSNHLILSGMCTHFAVSDSLDKENIEFTNKQYENFEKAIENVKNKGIDPGICSCSNSAAIMNNKNMHINMVRAGIITYGYYPDDITKEYLKSVNKDIELKPVLSLETKVVAIRHFKKGQSISYGRTYICEDDTDIAILPIGYADGLLRRFSPGLCVTINGKNYPVRGRICMDQCMVELGKNHNVKLWDKVLIFGPKESGALNTADDLAKIGNTISYEVLTSISKRIERVIK